MLIPTRWLMSHGLRTFVIVVPISLIAWFLISSVSTSALDATPSTLLHSSTKGRGGSRPSGKKGQFIQQLLAHDLNPEFNGTALAGVCASKVWHQGLIFSCDPAEGGIGNIRNIFLNCVRYAIEAGATQLVLPSLIPLQKSARIKPDPVSLAHFFDLDHFRNNLQRSCPQIAFLNDLNTLWDKPSTSPPVNVFPESLDTVTTTSEKHSYHQVAFLHSPATWSASFSTYLRKVHPESFSAAAPILVSLQPPLLLQWPLTHDTPSFVDNFGLLLQFKPEIKYMAASILYAIDQTHRLHYNPLFDGKKIQPRLFYGAHLRTGPDALSAGWTPYTIQAGNYLSGASKAELSLIYLSSDDREDTMIFAQQARSKGIEVTNSLQALSAPGLNGAMKLEHNQLARMDSTFKNCVDWIVLSRASVMGGTWESSFSWGIAMTRHRSAESTRWGLKPEITAAVSKPEAQTTSSKLVRRAKSATPVEAEDADQPVKPVKKVAPAIGKARTKIPVEDEDSDDIEAPSKALPKSHIKGGKGELELEDEEEDQDAAKPPKKALGSSKSTKLDSEDEEVDKDFITAFTKALDKEEAEEKKSSKKGTTKSKSKVVEADEEEEEEEEEVPVKSKSKPATKDTPIKKPASKAAKVLDEDEAPVVPVKSKPDTKTPKSTSPSKKLESTPIIEEEEPAEDDEEIPKPKIPPKKTTPKLKPESTSSKASSSSSNKEAVIPLKDLISEKKKPTSAISSHISDDKEKENEKDEDEEESEDTTTPPPLITSTGSDVGVPAKSVRYAFEDGLSTIYGPEGEGEMFWGAMWP